MHWEGTRLPERGVNWSFLAFVTLFSIGLSGSARADWMNLTGAETAPNIAEIYIEEDRVRLLLEVYIDDLETFHDLIPDDLLSDADPDRPPLAARLRQFAAQTFRVVTETGEALSAELKVVEPRLRKDRFSPYAGMINPTTRQRVPEPPADKRVLFAELDYPFAEPPKTLTFIPPIDEDGAARASIGFIAYHESVPVIDFRYLSAPVTLQLDWDDPWYSRFDNPTLKRHHKSALMSFLYVEPDQVRHEVLTRVKDLEAWMDLGLRSDHSIAPDEWDGLLARVGAFLLTRNPLVIDGRAVEPALTGASFVAVSLGGIQVIEAPRELDISTAIVGVILSYPVGALPDRVAVDWDLFTEQIQRVPTTTIDPAGPLASTVEPDDRIIEWQNFLVDYRPPKTEAVPLGPDHRLGLPLPALALLLGAIGAGVLALRPRWLARKVWAGVALASLLGAGLLSPIAVLEVENPFAGLPDRQATADIVGRLARNLHAALQERDEDRLRDALTVSVPAPLIAEILPELRRALRIEMQGGGTGRVDSVGDVVVQDIEDLGDGGGMRALAEWSADARAGHWGHLHQRRIRFSALIDLMPVEGAWKLTGITVLDVRQES